MQKLLEGIVQFRKESFKIHKDLFKGLKGRQEPHTLFISCSDSRIDPSMITGTLPGELFIIRNIANIVPPYHNALEHVATTSAIEYAVNILNVENIIICGHSNCGGCAASLNSSIQAEHLPHIYRWLELMNPVKERVHRENLNNEPNAGSRKMEQDNVVEQLKHLMTYSYIRKKVMTGHLKLSGWYYNIETGGIYIYNKDTEEFQLAN